MYKIDRTDPDSFSRKLPKIDRKGEGGGTGSKYRSLGNYQLSCPNPAIIQNKYFFWKIV